MLRWTAAEKKGDRLMYYKIRRILTWTLTAAVVLSSNSVTVLAENEDFSEFQDVEEDVSVTEDEVDFESETEIFRQPDIQTDVQEEVFSAGDNDEYAIWFQDSGDEEKNGFLYAYSDIKSARFYLNTDNLRDKDATIFWEVVLRKEGDEYERYSYISLADWPQEQRFWKVDPEDDSVIIIDGQKLLEAYKWKDENERYKDYWFAIYAYVLVRGNEVYCTQKGIYARTNIEEYILPKDQELFPGETYDINEEYLLYMDKAAFGGGQYITFPIWGVEVQTIEEKDKDPALEETEICTVEEKDRGWQIEAKRPGTARVILTYRDYAYEAEQYSFLIHIGESRCRHHWSVIKEVPKMACIPGIIYKKCENCGQENEDFLPAVHNYQWKTDIEPTCAEDGSRQEVCLDCFKTGKTEKIPAKGHVMGDWKVIRSATAVKEGLKERQCTVCGDAKETKKIKKLKPTIKLNVPVDQVLPLKLNQSFQVKVSGLAAGDKVVSWTSSNKKIVSVTDKGKITGNKVGEAVIKIKLRSGLTARFAVKVQKGAVRISSFKIFNKVTDKKIQKTVRMKVGEKLTLSAAAVPVTSKPQFTYSSSNEKIASVNSKGVITARKKGKAVITVECGKKAAKFKIEVVKR